MRSRPTTSLARARASAISGPALTTIDSGTSPEVEVGVDVLRLQIAGWYAEPRERHEEFDAPFATQPSRLARGQPAQIVELGREEQLCLLREFLSRQSQAQQNVVT